MASMRRRMIKAAQERVREEGQQRKAAAEERLVRQELTVILNSPYADVLMKMLVMKMWLLEGNDEEVAPDKAQRLQAGTRPSPCLLEAA